MSTETFEIFPTNCDPKETFVVFKKNEDDEENKYVTDDIINIDYIKSQDCFYHLETYSINFNQLNNFINGIFTDFQTVSQIRETDGCYDANKIMDYISDKYEIKEEDKDKLNEIAMIIQKISKEYITKLDDKPDYISLIDILKENEFTNDEFTMEKYKELLIENNKLGQEDTISDYLTEKFENFEFKEEYKTQISCDFTKIINKIDIDLDNDFQPKIDECINNINEILAKNVENKIAYIHKDFIKENYGFIRDKINEYESINETTVDRFDLTDINGQKLYYMYFDAMYYQIWFNIASNGDDNLPDFSDLTKETHLAGICISTITCL